MVKLSRKQRFFTRDLPDDYDPHYFYEYRIAKRSKEAAGVEGFVYKLLPFSLIRSFAFAIDPLSNFKTASGRVSAVNRSLIGTTVSVLDNSRLETNQYRAYVTAAQKNYLNHPGRYGPIVKDPPVTDDWTLPHGSQSVLPRYLKDTTRRTRPFGYTMGEFEKTIPKLYSSGRNLVWTENIKSLYSLGVGQDYPDYLATLKYWNYSIGPSAAVYPLNSYNTLRANEMSYLTAIMQKNAISMYKGINPSFRNYSLFRNVIELRDLPRSILTLKTSLDSFRVLERSLDPKILRFLREIKLGNQNESFFKNLPNEYLSYQFGWKQLYRDVMDLVRKPEMISRQIDFIIRNSGKSLTLRSKREFLSGGDAPGFVYDSLGGNLVEQQTNLVRKIELRMAVNMFFQFPTTNNPTFREDLFSRKIGAYPTFTDLYNLVPWTWLVDLFTGLGNYLEIIEEINKDKNLINWGFITGTSSIDVTTVRVDDSWTRVGVYMNGSGSTTETKVKNRHSSILHLDLQLRKNIASIFDVNSTSEPSSLTTYQSSILGALISQRTKLAR